MLYPDRSHWADQERGRMCASPQAHISPHFFLGCCHFWALWGALYHVGEMAMNGQRWEWAWGPQLLPSLTAAFELSEKVNREGGGQGREGEVEPELRPASPPLQRLPGEGSWLERSQPSARTTSPDPTLSLNWVWVLKIVQNQFQGWSLWDQAPSLLYTCGYGANLNILYFCKVLIDKSESLQNLHWFPQFLHNSFYAGSKHCCASNTFE